MYVPCMGPVRNAYILGEKCNIPLGRPRHKWEANIKMHLKGVDWI